MSHIVNLEKLFHRSKDRIRDLGEVFTPESYVEDMLDLLAKDKRGFWSDEDIAFFEPCSGHGNIVIPIYKRRLEAIYKKAVTHGFNGKSSEAPYYAVANALNTLWAIDIDPKNVENCRSRVLSTTLDFLKSKLQVKSDLILLTKKKDFFAHVISAIKWHIDENETLSAVSKPQDAKANACLTKSGAKWFLQNGHQQLDFNLTWANYYESQETRNATPLDFERSLKFIENSISGRLRGFEDLDFAKAVIQIGKIQDNAETKPSRSLTAGA